MTSLRQHEQRVVELGSGPVSVSPECLCLAITSALSRRAAPSYLWLSKFNELNEIKPQIQFFTLVTFPVLKSHMWPVDAYGTAQI